MPWQARLSFAFIIGVFAAQSASGGTSRPIPAEVLFRAPQVSEARISPDGRHVGLIVNDEQDAANLLIFDENFKASELRGRSDFDIYDFDWLGSDRILFSIAKEKLYSWGLFTARLDRIWDSIPVDAFDVIEIVGKPQSRPTRVIAWIRKSALEDGKPGDLVELDAGHHFNESQPMQMASAAVHIFPEPNDGPAVAFASDQNGEIALCTTWSGGRLQLHRFNVGRDPWTKVPTDPGTAPMAMDFDARFVWVVTASKDSGYALRRCNLATGELDAPILTDANYDIGEGLLHFSRAHRQLAGITYGRRKPVSFWRLKPFMAAQTAMDKLNPDSDNVLVGQNDAETKFLFRVGGPQHPSDYEVLNIEDRTLKELGGAARWHQGVAFRTVDPISFVTRDGLKLEGYEALPEGATRDHPVPLVVLVHGGPGVRDVHDFDPIVQFLVSRGYAVLQPNYRGSSGYSFGISHGSTFDFVGMRNDVTDATRAFIRTGLADPARVAIMGGSFGGYLAVAGVAFEEGVYRCAITECGVFDWKRLIESKKYTGRPAEYEILLDKIGHPDRDAKNLDDISPINHVDGIHVPVLIAHGTEDSVVDVAQSKRLASELRRRGVPCETFYRSVEGHGFFNYENRVEFYHRVEAFLAANLGGLTLTPVK